MLNGLFDPKDPNNDKSYNECVIREHFSVGEGETQCWVSTHFIAFLRQGILGDELKELLVKFAGQSLLSNHLTSFRRGVALLQHLGNNY